MGCLDGREFVVELRSRTLITKVHRGSGSQTTTSPSILMAPLLNRQRPSPSTPVATLVFTCEYYPFADTLYTIVVDARNYSIL
jgi:hypothetical protein